MGRQIQCQKTGKVQVRHKQSREGGSKFPGTYFDKRSKSGCNGEKTLYELPVKVGESKEPL